MRAAWRPSYSCGQCARTSPPTAGHAVLRLPGDAIAEHLSPNRGRHRTGNRHPTPLWAGVLVLLVAVSVLVIAASRGGRPAAEPPSFEVAGTATTAATTPPTQLAPRPVPPVEHPSARTPTSPARTPTSVVRAGASEPSDTRSTRNAAPTTARSAASPAGVPPTPTTTAAAHTVDLKLKLRTSAGAANFTATLTASRPETVTVSYTLRGQQVITGTIAANLRVSGRVELTRTVKVPPGDYHWSWTLHIGSSTRTGPEQSITVP
jgi:hypothetical protein